MYFVIMIHRSVIAVYILIMLFKFCHLNFISHSSSSFNIYKDPTEGFNALQTFSKSFSHDSFSNFSLFSLITQNGKTSLFVVCKNDTIIQIAIETMEMVNIYRKNGCSYSLKYECEEPVTINLLSEINLLNQKMMWFCYILPHNNFPNPSLTNCLVPKNNILPDDLKWTKVGFTSTSNFYRTFAVQTKPHIFIGSYSSNSNSLLILRTKLPNILGKIDSSQDLITPMAPFYFERNSQFLEVFSTQYEVYYVVVEPITAKSHSISECISSSDTRMVISTRLIRICKDDPGGGHQYNYENFGTTAKADIVCPVGDGPDQYFHTRSISASWSGDKLYMLFESQKNSPPGKVLCVYDEFAFNIAFESEMIQPIIFEHLKNNPKFDNNIKDLCKKLTENSLNDYEKTEAQSMSTSGLYRSKRIIPIREVPLINLRNLSYNSISTFKLSKFDATTIIVFIAESSIRMISHMEDLKVCFIQDFHFQTNETISQVKGENIHTKVFVHISTNKRMIQLELIMCDKYQEQQICLTYAPSICGWDARRRRCTLLTEDIDLSRWKRSACQNISFDDSWSLPEPCMIRNNQETLNCICKYCLEESKCSEKKKVDITNCTTVKSIDTYGDWSPWSECSLPFNYQKRTRECTGTKCSGPFSDLKKCEHTSTSVTTTNWTKWYKSDTSKYRISFRAKCPKNPLLPPSIEEREILCDESCMGSEDSLKWSSWSECTETNIQFRLLNCSTLDGCPNSRTEIKKCPVTPSKSKELLNDKEGEYSIIHIALAVLVVSLIWLIILILVSILIFRFNFITKKKGKLHRKKSKIPLTGLSTVLSSTPYSQQRSLFSETSNEYLSPDVQSSSYNPMVMNSSYTSVTDNDTIHQNPINIFARVPLISDKHQNIHDD